MPAEISPRKVQESVHKGFQRLDNFRQARLMFLRQYVGQYYDRESGSIGTEPLNLIFNAIRVLVPEIVMSFPKHAVTSRFLASREYAQLLGLALDQHSRDVNIKSKYRQIIVDAIFTLGIMKTGLAESDSVYAFDEYDTIDPGTVYSEVVSFDNFVADARSREHLFADAAYMGDRIAVPRQKLLESGLYRNDLVERLPSIDEDYSSKKADRLSRRKLTRGEEYGLEDEVEIVELWVPDARAIVTIPGAKDVSYSQYLRVDDYYGPNTGPYSFLALTPPVSDNPLPVPMVGIWHDLHVLANRMAKKVIDQAERQKDVVAYRRAAADDAEELRDAGDGDAVATDDPDGVRVLSFGGQKQSNEVMTAQLQGWFNMMAANPQGVGGQQLDADSATEARILQNNASVGLEDMKDLVYTFAADESRKRAWYFHTDPFIQVPLIRRDQIPAQYQMTPYGPMATSGPQMVESQVILTPEARRGDWLDFTFAIEPESLGREDSQTRLRRAMEFAVQILPAATQAAQMMALLGIPFDVKAFIIRMARETGIDWMDEVFYDPDFQMRMARVMMSGPSPQGSQGQPGQQDPTRGMAAILQNGQPGQVQGDVPGPVTEFRQNAQEGANAGQADLRGLGSVLG